MVVIDGSGGTQKSVLLLRKGSDAAMAGATAWPERCQAAGPFQFFYVIRKKQQLLEAEVLLSRQGTVSSSAVWLLQARPQKDHKGVLP